MTAARTLWPGLPPDCELVYIVPQEEWCASSSGIKRPFIEIQARCEGDGCHWEFQLVDKSDIGVQSIQLRMFDDTWDAFMQIPEFFVALREHRPETLNELRTLLNNLGIRDATKRSSPYRKLS